jgi:hypothetical protein
MVRVVCRVGHDGSERDQVRPGGILNISYGGGILTFPRPREAIPSKRDPTAWSTSANASRNGRAVVPLNAQPAYWRSTEMDGEAVCTLQGREGRDEKKAIRFLAQGSRR